MFNKNLKYYRLMNNWSKKDLAEKVGISPMAITNYENGDRMPDMTTIKKIAEALNVRVTDFLVSRNSDLSFSHEKFRKNSKLRKGQQEYIKENIEEYFNRFYETVELLGGEILPEYPVINSVEYVDDVEAAGRSLRKFLNAAISGPIGNLIDLLENQGILVYLMDYNDGGFSGINGNVNGRPYIAVNANMAPERIRTTIGHELAHLALKWPDDMEDSEIEKKATAIGGAFLLPESDLKREIGIRRTSITTDWFIVCKEYGVAMSLLVMRAKNCNVISETLCSNFFKQLNKSGGRRSEQSFIQPEKVKLFPQLVYRAVNENEITIQKGAELLHSTYEDVANNCCYVGA